LRSVLRTLAEGRVKWAFWPPGHQAHPVDATWGIWLQSGTAEDSEEDSDVEDEAEQEDENGSETEDSREEDGTEQESTSITIARGGGRFGPLALADGGTDEDEGA
jgi:hypothetical protein